LPLDKLPAVHGHHADALLVFGELAYFLAALDGQLAGGA
jgi:hypothetical protein